MNQLLKNFIPLGDTGNICYLLDNLKDFDSKDSISIQARCKDFKTKKIQKLIMLQSLTKSMDYESIATTLSSSGFSISVYKSNLELKSQVELFERVLDANKQGNIGILFFGISPALIDLIIKMMLYIDNNVSISEIYNYLTNDEPDELTLGELKSFQNFLEFDPYLITKPDRAEFRKISPKLLHTVETKSALSAEAPSSTTAFTLNLSSLNLSVIDDEQLLTEKEAINFNLNSLVESDFKKEESAEEYYEKIKNTQTVQEVDDSLSLDVDLSEEIEYISSLESLSGSSMDKVSAINIDTIPLDNEDLPKISTPTIDYKTKNYLDFDAIINEEIEQGMLADGFDMDFAMDFDDMPSEDNTIIPPQGDSTINLDTVETQAKIDLSFPPPLQDLEDLLEEEMELENEKIGAKEEPVDPSQTFMAKRINDVIKNEVLNEDSKGKIPVSNLTKVDTESTEAIPKTSNPTTPVVSSPKISSPKFNPITLDD